MRSKLASTLCRTLSAQVRHWEVHRSLPLGICSAHHGPGPVAWLGLVRVAYLFM